MHREKFPEKIPFRLTRMLTHAMEVSGIEGSFRNTCEISMKVLRENKESLMAVLEAFVYDPLINWRLMQPDVERRGEGTHTQCQCTSYGIRRLLVSISHSIGQPYTLVHSPLPFWSEATLLGSYVYNPVFQVTAAARLTLFALLRIPPRRSAN